jgi:hypothetical protein
MLSLFYVMEEMFRHNMTRTDMYEGRTTADGDQRSAEWRFNRGLHPFDTPTNRKVL